MQKLRQLRKMQNFFGVFRINTGSWYFKTPQTFWWIFKYYSRYLSQIPLETVLFPIQILGKSYTNTRHAGKQQKQRALSIRPNIPVWNSGYSMRRMEQYFPVRWTNQSQIIRFQDSRENTRSNGGLFYLCLLALGLFDDSEVEINDVLGEGDNITFIVRI